MLRGPTLKSDLLRGRAVDPDKWAEFGKQLHRYSQQAQKDVEWLHTARTAIDRAIGIETGRIPPPWAKKLLEKLQPPTAMDVQPVNYLKTKIWIADDIERLKIAGEIPETITALARLLEKRMLVAAKDGKLLRAVGYRYIRDSLRNWKFWPISSIK